MLHMVFETDVRRENMKYAISSCLMGINCKYSGGNNTDVDLMDYMRDKTYIVLCPEVLGGLSIPRACSEQCNGRVITSDDEDVSEAFLLGAQKAMQELYDHDIDLVITQPRSPSCGKGRIYDGTFSNKLINGDGIFVQLCLMNGFEVMNVDEFRKQYIYKATKSL